ncbi:hypothetical protein Clacol_000478 [Clathrus columnatus]|uniref:Altered inheritance of mitochondria protein 41 n=1 Tax=Clathrus columnatus TaxID=1419009 RepID=A0AAV4ZWR0_9AGAM|nr:hypothetical protein Clacol_000478 [Clathrus columnatus]
MKAKDSSTTTIIRTVLSDIYAAQKDSYGKTFQQSDFFSIIRKAHQRRLDAATQFELASRSDMAEKERGEATVLSNYLPAVMDPSEINTLLRDVLKTIPEDVKKDANTKKTKGLVIKEFYKRVDKSRVSGDVLMQQLDEVWVSQN